MDCEKCQENLSSLIDGELGKKQYQTILSHLLKCHSCSNELRALLNLQNIVKEHTPLKIPDESLWEKIASHLKPRERIVFSIKRFFQVFSMQPVFLKRIEAALVIIFSIFAFIYFTNSQIIINKKEFSVRFRSYQPEIMSINEKTNENLSRRESSLLID